MNVNAKQKQSAEELQMKIAALARSPVVFMTGELHNAFCGDVMLGAHNATEARGDAPALFLAIRIAPDGAWRYMRDPEGLSGKL